MSDQSFIGKGIMYLDGRDVGNVSNLEFSPQYETKKLPNYRSSGGGSYNSLPRITSVELSCTLHDYSPENLSLALFGSATAYTGTTVTDEAQTTPADVSADVLLLTDHVIDTASTTTVTGYTEGTDFTVTAAGILILAAGSIPASTALAISYTSKSSNVIEALVTSAQEFLLAFDGVNEAQNDTPFVARVYRAKFSPTDTLAVIGDEFGEVQLVAELLADTSITTSGLSQYFKIDQA